MKKLLFTLLFTYFSALNLSAQGTVLSAGDLSVVYYQGDDPDAIGLITFVPLATGTTIYFTDCGAVAGSGALYSPCDEGARKFVVTTPIPEGEIIFWDANTTDTRFSIYSEPGVLDGNLLFSTGGDQALVFQDTDGAGGTAPASNPTFICALSSASTQWMGDPSDKNESSLPNGLTDGTTALAVGAGSGVDEEFDNVIFNTSGMPYASLAALKVAIQNPANWYGAQILGDMTYQGYLSDLMNQNLLPVELLEFNAALKKNVVELTWSTATEINNQGFEIQQSVDSKDWKTIDFVEGRGDTEIVQEYKYQHKNPNEGFNYYRLKQIDYDGAFEYSKIEVARFNDTALGENEIRVFPNPTKDLLQINWATDISKNGRWEYRVFNSTGLLIQRAWINVDDNNFEIDVSTLGKGFYIMELKRMGVAHVARFVKE